MAVVLCQFLSCHLGHLYGAYWLSWLGIRLEIERLLVRVSPPAESLWCVCEQETIRCYVLVQPRKTRPDMTEKLLTGTKRIKPNKQNLGSPWPLPSINLYITCCSDCVTRTFHMQGFRFVSRFVSQSDLWSKKWWVIF